MLSAFLSEIFNSIINSFFKRFMNKKIQNNKENFTINEQGYYVLKSNSLYMSICYLFFFIALIGICFSICLFFINVDASAYIFAFSVAIGLTSIIFTKASRENRVEFNYKEIRQYLYI